MSTIIHDLYNAIVLKVRLTGDTYIVVELTHQVLEPATVTVSSQG